MKTAKLLCCLALLSALLLPASAQVTNFAVFKVTVYHQTSTTPPVTPDFPNAYYFNAQLNLTESYYYFKGAGVTWVTGPDSSPAASGLSLNFTSPLNLDYSGQYYSTKSQFDADFGPGDYLFEGYPYGDSGTVTIPDTDLYSTNIPAYSPASWNKLQQVDPSQDLSFCLNSFDVFPGADLALTFVNVFDPLGVSLATYSTNGVSLLVTNIIIPANTLQYGVNYEVDTFFSSRTVTPDAGFDDAPGFVAFDDLNYTTLATILPPLCIAPSGTNIVVSWPSLASNFSLQTTTNLMDATTWNTVTNIIQPPGLTNSAVFPACGTACFYRLTSTSQVIGGGGGGGT